MAGEIHLDVSAWDQFLGRLSGNVRKATEILKVACSTIGFADIIGHFDDESGPDGPWPKRSANTDRIYDLIGSGKLRAPRGGRAGSYSSSNKLLQLTGKLRQTLNPGRGGVRVVGTAAVKMLAGTNYSRKHDEGDPSSYLPKREFMWLSGKGQQLMANFVRDKFLEGA